MVDTEEQIQRFGFRSFLTLEKKKLIAITYTHVDDCQPLMVQQIDKHYNHQRVRIAHAHVIDRH